MHACGSLQEQGRGRACSPPCPELRRSDGRLFVANADDVPDVVHPRSELRFPMHLGSITELLLPPQSVRPEPCLSPGMLVALCL